MASLFHYNTLQVSLDRMTRSLVVRLDRPEHKNALNGEMIFELESVLAWCTSHLEINSILLSSTSSGFSCGADLDEMDSLGKDRLKKRLTKVQRLIYSMFFLPQTIIADLRGQAIGLGAELAIGADLRFAQDGTKVSFSQLDHGLTPCCGGVGFLGATINPVWSRNWVLGGGQIPMDQLTESGFVAGRYSNFIDDNLDSDTDHPIYNALLKVADQAPVQRIQSKRSLLESILPDLDRALEFERRFAFAGLESDDWREGRGEGAVTFKSAREFTHSIS
jgi:enoyl-CoA hydratase/carnithine racemase